MGYKNDDRCLDKAEDDEPIFVLLGRDLTAPETIIRWVEARLGKGLNKHDDAQIVEALAHADRMVKWAMGYRKDSA